MINIPKLLKILEFLSRFQGWSGTILVFLGQVLWCHNLKHEKVNQADLLVLIFFFVGGGGIILQTAQGTRTVFVRSFFFQV